MSAGNSIDAMLSKAKSTLNHANKFSDSVGPKMAAPKPAHEFSSTPYRLASGVSKAMHSITDPSDSTVKAAGDVGSSIKSNMDNAKAAGAVLPK